MIDLLTGIALGSVIGYTLARILARYGVDPVGPDARTEGRLKLLESASLRHGASIKVLTQEVLPREDPPVPDIVWTQADPVVVTIPEDRTATEAGK